MSTIPFVDDGVMHVILSSYGVDSENRSITTAKFDNGYESIWTMAGDWTGDRNTWVGSFKEYGFEYHIKTIPDASLSETFSNRKMKRWTYFNMHSDDIICVLFEDAQDAIYARLILP
jgi:hypothetical protein